MGAVVIIGAGGHARSVAAVLLELAEYQLVGFIDIHHDEQTSEKIADIPVYPGKSNLRKKVDELGVKLIVLAVGDNVEREKIYLSLKNHFSFPNIISKSAIVKTGVVLGQANIILDQAYVGPFSRLGDNNLLNTRALIEHECVVDSSNHFAPACVLLGRVNVGSRNFVGSTAVVKQGVSISNDITVGANGFVSQSIEKSGTYVGLPVIQKGHSS